jgi:hypothetical protein
MSFPKSSSGLFPRFAFRDNVISHLSQNSSLSGVIWMSSHNTSLSGNSRLEIERCPSRRCSSDCETLVSLFVLALFSPLTLTACSCDTPSVGPGHGGKSTMAHTWLSPLYISTLWRSVMWYTCPSQEFHSWTEKSRLVKPGTCKTLYSLTTIV